VTLECVSRISTGAALYWFDVTSCANYSPTCDRRKRIYNGFNVANDAPSRFDVTEVDNATHATRNLTIESTQLGDAGVYLCAVKIAGESGFLESTSAHHIVLGNCICLLTAS